MVKIITIVLLVAMCLVGVSTASQKHEEARIERRDEIEPPTIEQLNARMDFMGNIPSPNQYFLAKRYLSGEIDRSLFEERWRMWEEHHTSKLTKYGMKAQYEKRGGLDLAASIATIASAGFAGAEWGTSVARYLSDLWNRRQQGQLSGPSDIENIAVSPAVSIRLNTRPEPTGTFDAAGIQAAMDDAVQCMRNGNARQVCIVANSDGTASMTAQYGVAADGLPPTPPDDASCENSVYDDCLEGDAPPIRDELRKGAPPKYQEKNEKRSVCGEGCPNRLQSPLASAGALQCDYEGGSCVPACMTCFELRCDSLGIFGTGNWMGDDACKNCICA